MAPTSCGRYGVLLSLVSIALASLLAGCLGNDARDPGEAAGAAALPQEEAADAAAGLPVGSVATIEIELMIGCAAYLLVTESGDLCSGGTAHRTTVTEIGEGLTALTIHYHQRNDAATAPRFCYRFAYLDVNETRCNYQIFQERYEFKRGDVPAGTVLRLDLWMARPVQLAMEEHVWLAADLEYHGGPPPVPHRNDHVYQGEIACAATFTVVQSRDVCGMAPGLGTGSRFLVPLEKNLTAVVVSFAAGESLRAAEFQVFWTVPSGGGVPGLECAARCVGVVEFGPGEWRYADIPLDAEFTVLISRAHDAPAATVAADFTVEVSAFYHGMPVPDELVQAAVAE